MLKERNEAGESTACTNVRIIDRTGTFPEVFIKAPMIMNGRAGQHIAVYSYDNEIRATGPGLNPKHAPRSFSKLPDCEYSYYGLMLNVIAFLNDSRPEKMCIVDSYNRQELKVVMFKPNVAIDFIKWAIGNTDEVSDEVVIPKSVPGFTKQYQQALFI